MTLPSSSFVSLRRFRSLDSQATRGHSIKSTGNAGAAVMSFADLPGLSESVLAMLPSER